MIAKSSESEKSCTSLSLDTLLKLANDAKQFSLETLHAKSPQSGQRISSLLARGMEFAESRHYQTGDDIRNIDWRVTARTGKAHTKLFAAEKERPVLLGVDLRSPMFFATQGVFKSVQAGLMTGYLAWNTAQSGNRLGGAIFNNAGVQEYRPTLGKRGVLPFLNGLSEQTFKNSEHNAALSHHTMDAACASLCRLAAPGSLVFLVSDFRHFSPIASNLLLQISRHCDLYLCFIYDPIEQGLPKNGYYPFSNGNHHFTVNTHDKRNLEAYAQQFIKRRQQAVILSGRRRIRFMECRTDEICFDLLMKYFG